jgi:hypothetical protein
MKRMSLSTFQRAVDRGALTLHPQLSRHASEGIGTTVEVYENPATGAFVQHLPFVCVNVFADRAAWQASVATIIHAREGFASDPVALLGNAFAAHIDRHLRSLQQHLRLVFDPAHLTPAVVEAVDQRVRALDYRAAFSTVFPGLVAFVGEALRQQLHGRWAEAEVVIQANGNTYNPYRSLFKEYVEGTAHLRIASLILAERHKYFLSTPPGNAVPPQEGGL